ncbi:MAG: hypothetical protein OEY77_10415 [Nitrospira sp.]|nr:hypothetical protein [Nitrospira sp.]
MSEHDLEKLLGAFAADTLTPEEKQQLYSAALQDQELFNALADEQALKDLLADPVVRRRLLQSVQETPSTTDGGSASWLDWFRRPSGLAWAGGLAAAVFAVILGTNIYQESLRQAGRSLPIEEKSSRTPPTPAPSEPQPTSPPISESQSRAQATTKLADTPRKEAHAAKKAKQETKMTAKSNEEQATTYPEPDVLRGRSRSTPRTFAQSKENAPDSADHDRASAPSASTLVPAPANVPAAAAPTSQLGSALSARSLFYGDTGELSSGLMAGEQERNHVTQQFEGLERKKSPSRASQRGSLASSTTPLGIRYSLMNHGMDGSRSDRNAGTPIATDSIDLMVEANQDSFFQVWGEAASLPPHLLFPFSAGDPIASRLMAYQRRRIPILAGYRSITVRVSLTPFDALSTKDSDAMTRSPLEHLQESSSSIETSNSQEQATYIVNQDPSVGMLVVRIPIH